MHAVTAISGGTTLIEGRLVPDAVVLVRGGRIEAVGASVEVRIPPKTQKTDAAGRFVVPGFIDIHIHGWIL
jgi:imidazolonepropionase-like amidohydrolase